MSQVECFQRRSHAPSALVKRVRSDDDGGGVGSTVVNGVFRSPLTQSSDCKRARKASVAARKKYAKGGEEDGEGDRQGLLNC